MKITFQEVVQQLLSKSANFRLPMGVEIEFFLFSLMGEPIDLTENRNKSIFENAPDMWYFGTDLGKNMMEIAFHRASCMQDFIQQCIEIFGYLQNHEVSREWIPHFGDNTDTSLGYVSGSRYKALLKGKGGRNLLDQMIKYASLQVNLGVSDIGGIFSDDTKKLLYVLNNWAPALALIFEEMTGGLESKRLPNCFVNFADPLNLPGFREFSFYDNLEKSILSVPYYARRVGGDEWRVAYDGEVPRTLDEVDFSTIWWDVRPKGLGDRGCERIELRSPTTTTPMGAIKILPYVDRIVGYILDTQRDKIPLFGEEKWGFIRRKNDIQKALKVSKEIIPF